MTDRLRRFLGSLGSMLLALLLAFAIWIAATLTEDPFDYSDFTDLPIRLLNQPADTVFAEPLVDRATVRVRAPRSVLRTLARSDFDVAMDLAQATVGETSIVPVEVASDREVIRIESVTPSQQTVYLEAVDTVTVPIVIQVRGEVAMGYQLGTPTIVPDAATVTGPVSLLSQMAAVTGTLSINGAKEALSAQVSIAPRDDNGRILNDLEWQPTQVKVDVGMRRRLGFKPDVTVIPNLQGDPAPGYRRGSVTIEPSTVTLAGQPSALDQLPAFVMTNPVSVTGATDDLVVRTTITVPTSIVVVDTQYVTVTLEVLPIESSRVVTAAVVLQGLRSTWVASLSPATVQAILVGPDAVLAALQPGDVQATINLFDYALGVHRLEPEVLAPEGVTVVSVLPETVEVVIAQAISGTPTPTRPTPTPARPF